MSVHHVQNSINLNAVVLGGTPSRDVFGLSAAATDWRSALTPSVPATPYSLPALFLVPTTAKTVYVILNGVTYTEGIHYTISGTAITWLGELLSPPIPIDANDTFDIRYES